MQTNNILSAKLIDLIFDGRNKEYGAYELRKTYQVRISKAVFITLTLTALAFGGTTLANSFKKKKQEYKMIPVVELAEVKEKLPEKLPEPERKPAEPEVKTQKLTDPVIVEDENLKDPLPTQEDLNDSKIDSKTTEGIPDDGTPKEPLDIDNHQGIVEEKEKKEPDQIISIVEVEAKYSGNWERFLRQNLNPEIPIQNNAPPGTYSVVIQFVVDKEGNVSDIKPLTAHGYGMEQEAVRVLKKAMKWSPAIQNGYVVKAYRRQPITFQVLEE